MIARLLFESLLTDVFFWLPWIPLTHVLRTELGSSLVANLLSSVLFLSPKLIRWFTVRWVGKLVDDGRNDVLKNSILIQGLLILASAVSSNVYFLLGMAALRGLVQASFDVARPSTLKTMGASSQSAFQIVLIPSLAMGIGSILGWFLLGYTTLSALFVISGVGTLVVYVFHSSNYLRKSSNTKTNTNDQDFPAPQGLDQIFADRFSLACAFGGTPLLMHLKFETIKSNGVGSFALFMASVSFGVGLACVSPQMADRFTKLNRYFFILTAWVFQVLLLKENLSQFEIIAYSVVTVYFQFLFSGAVSRTMLSSLSPSVVGSASAVATRFELAGAVAAHLIYGTLTSLLSSTGNFLVSTLLAFLVWIVLSRSRLVEDPPWQS